MTTASELSRDISEPELDAWRRLDPPVVVNGYIAQGWHDVRAVAINDDTREIRIEWPPPQTGGVIDRVTHKVLNRALYQAPAGAFTAKPA
jgi:hypothetical protein